jgi:hypothetical protein
MGVSELRLFVAMVMLGSVLGCSPTPPPEASSSVPAAAPEPAPVTTTVAQPDYVRGYY